MGTPGSFEKCPAVQGREPSCPAPAFPEQTPAPRRAPDVLFPPKALGEPLYRVSTGNYEYRLVLRCRQEARARFSQMRKDVLEKMELLDQKHGEGPGGRRAKVHPSPGRRVPPSVWWGCRPPIPENRPRRETHLPEVQGQARPCRALSRTRGGKPWQECTQPTGPGSGGPGLRVPSAAHPPRQVPLLPG